MNPSSSDRKYSFALVFLQKVPLQRDYRTLVSAVEDGRLAHYCYLIDLILDPPDLIVP